MGVRMWNARTQVMLASLKEHKAEFRQSVYVQMMRNVYRLRAMGLALFGTLKDTLVTMLCSPLPCSEIFATTQMKARCSLVALTGSSLTLIRTMAIQFGSWKARLLR